jgi:hypothetical protein
MNNENDLIKRLMVSKAIMDKHNTMGRGGIPTNIDQTPMVEDYQAPASNYNLPEEFVSEQKTIPNPQPLTADRIMGSKLPDAIKQLMMENPISQPTSMNGGATLSDDLVEKAARLMNNDVANNVNPFQPKKQQVQENLKSQNMNSSFDKNMLKDIIRETIEEVLSENGLLVESTSKTNDVFQFRVGSHIFEGKVTKIKKIK